MTTYAITVEVGSAKGPTAAAVDRLLELLTPRGISVSGDTEHTGWSATFNIDAADVRDAAVYGLEDVLHAGREAKMPIGPVEALEVLTVDEQDRRLALPTIPELVGAAEAAELLGVSRQRVHQLHTENPRFPEPAVQVRMGPLWTLASVEAFAGAWERRPGRPRVVGKA